MPDNVNDCKRILLNILMAEDDTFETTYSEILENNIIQADALVFFKDGGENDFEPCSDQLLKGIPMKTTSTTELKKQLTKAIQNGTKAEKNLYDVRDAYEEEVADLKNKIQGLKDELKEYDSLTSDITTVCSIVQRWSDTYSSEK